MIFYRIPVSKWGWYSLQSRTTRWVKNWLGWQALSVVVNGLYSAWRLVTNRAPQGCILEPVLSNMFTNNQEEEEVKHTLIKFANHAKTERVSGTLEGRAAVQSRNLTFNEGKCRVLLLGWNDPSDGTGWGLMGWTAGLGGPWQWWGCLNTSMTSRLREVTIPFTQRLLCHIDNILSSFGVPL